MVIVIIALVLKLMGMHNNSATEVIVIPPMPSAAPVAIAMSDDDEWELYNQEAYYDYHAQFTALFNSYTTKRARNGAMMISRDGKNYRFAKKG